MTLQRYVWLLWFAFVLWIYDICHNSKTFFPNTSFVVICFCSLNLWYLPQHTTALTAILTCCDLLLFFEFMIFATTFKDYALRWVMLWFAFVLWIYDICHNCINVRYWKRIVVICFCSLNLWYLPQQIVTTCIISYSCDLLLFFEFMIFATTHLGQTFRV